MSDSTTCVCEAQRLWRERMIRGRRCPLCGERLEAVEVGNPPMAAVLCPRPSCNLVAYERDFPTMEAA